MAKKVAGKQAAAPAFALYGELSEKQMRALGQQLDKLQDPNGFKHYQLLAKHAKGPNAPLLWHLLRCGLVGQEVQSAGLYTRFAEYIPDDVTAADVIALLRRVPALDRTQFAVSTDATRYHLNGVFFEHLENGVMRMTAAQKAALKQFYEVTIDMGALPFNFPDQEGGTVLVRFAKGSQPTWLQTARGIYRVNISLVVMP